MDFIRENEVALIHTRVHQTNTNFMSDLLNILHACIWRHVYVGFKTCRIFQAYSLRWHAGHAVLHWASWGHSAKEADIVLFDQISWTFNANVRHKDIWRAATSDYRLSTHRLPVTIVWFVSQPDLENRLHPSCQLEKLNVLCCNVVQQNNG